MSTVLIDHDSISSGNTYYSPWRDMSGYSAVAWQTDWTGTPTGTAWLEVSLDKATWNTLTNSAVSLGGTTGTQVWERPMKPAAQWYRAALNCTGGSGTWTSQFNPA